MNDVFIITIVFGLSFLFSLGGVGSATAIVPILVFSGESFDIAKNAGLFVNTLSSSVSTLHHHKGGHMEWPLALALAIPSVFLAPLGAIFSQNLSHKHLLIIFSLFLIYSATVLLFLKKKECSKEPKILKLLGIGSLAGFFAGLLGIGGGSIISPMLLLMNIDTKRVAMLTPFAVFLSSLSGFITYTALGHIDLNLLAIVAIPALIGGYLGAHTMQYKLSPYQIKIIIGIIFYILATKALLSAVL